MSDDVVELAGDASPLVSDRGAGARLTVPFQLRGALFELDDSQQSSTDTRPNPATPATTTQHPTSVPASVALPD